MFEFAVDRKTLVSGSLGLAVAALLIFAAGGLTGVLLATPPEAATAVVLAAHVEAPPPMPVPLPVPGPATAPPPPSPPPATSPARSAVLSFPRTTAPPPAVLALAKSVVRAEPPRVARRRPRIEPVPAALPAPAAEPAAEAPALRYRLGQPIPQTPYGSLIYRVARRHRLNPELVAAVVWAESGFDPEAVSPRGARGLMQVLPDTGERFGISRDQLFEPEQNLAAGASYLSWLVDRYGDRLELVLAAYNAGEGAVEEIGDVPPYPETLGYVERVRTRLGGGDATALP